MGQTPDSSRKQRGRKHNRFVDAPPSFFQNDDLSTDSGTDEAGSQTQPLRSVNMNTFASQPPSRQGPRLQNSQKTGLGNGNAGAGWAFGAPSSAGAFGGLGGAPGLSQGRPGQLSGFAQIMGGGGGQGPIDMSDFPSLAGSSRPQQATSGGWNSNVIRQPPPQQQQQASQPPIQQQQQPRAPSTAPSHQSLDQFDGQRSQQPSSERNGGGGDEFPPLGGQLNGDSTRQTNGFGNLGASSTTHIQTNGQQTSIPLTLNDVAATFEAQTQAQTQAAPPGLTNSSQSTTASKPWAEMTEQEKWGLAGLNKMLETAKAMQTGGEVDPTLPIHLRNSVMLNIGHDLNDLGLDLESSEPLYKTFHPFPDHNNIGTPFDSRARQPVPEFTVPPAYHVNNVPPMEQRMSAFSDETLFAIFFQNPKDLKQELAAIELTSRDWRWHKLLRQWLQKDTREANAASSIHDYANTIPIGVSPIRISDQSEKGVYIFFNHNIWARERREFVLNYNELEVRTGSVSGGGGGGMNPSSGLEKA